jgi:UDP-N-acetylmuramate dehydrogenase
MNILENYSLKHLNTFGIDVKARYFTELGTEDEIIKFLRAIQPGHKPLLILGGGSNVLFRRDYPGTVIRISTKGVSMMERQEDHIILKVAAGENWDDFVGYCVDRGWGGLENLSLIPGNVGTSPVQNIGAYGAELKDVLLSVETVHIDSGSKRTFAAEECGLNYRESIFKTRYKGEYIILNCTFRLSLKPVLNLGYAALREEVERMSPHSATIRTVRDAVIRIRREKLPDPAIVGNAGSFFKNPSFSEKKLSEIRLKFPGIPHYDHGDGVKVPAAWLIDQCGWKGKRFGDAGVHVNQPLVLVNYGNASGEEILALGLKIRDSVLERFGIDLEPEVNII